VRPEGLSMKNSSDTIGNRTRDFSACSAVPKYDKSQLFFFFCYFFSEVKYYEFGIQKKNVLNSRCLLEEFHPNVNTSTLLFVMPLRMKLINEKDVTSLEFRRSRFSWSYFTDFYRFRGRVAQSV